MKTLSEYPGGGRGMEGYFAFLRERYQILQHRRKGHPAPWTEDPVMRAWRFCNVRREDDKVTTWFRENIRNPLQHDPKVFFATIAFRWFNTIEAGKVLKPWLLGDRWDRRSVQQELEILAHDGVSIFTGAFMINSAPGLPKHIDVLDNLDKILDDLEGGFRLSLRLAKACATSPWTKKEMMRKVLEYPRLGNFAAYQVVVDLQYTYLLRNAADLQTFTVAGPGCAKGIGLCFHDDPQGFSYGNREHQKLMLDLMIECREASLDRSFWPSNWPPFVLSDIENGFCEYAKWRTGHEGQRLKRKFTPST